MKLRAYLIDDEPLTLGRLRRLLDQTGRGKLLAARPTYMALSLLSARWSGSQ
jgi:hypothetical protein